MDFFITYGADPWGRPIVTHVSWGAVWVSAFVGVSPRTAAEDWRVARAWLRRELERRAS